MAKPSTRKTTKAAKRRKRRMRARAVMKAQIAKARYLIEHGTPVPLPQKTNKWEMFFKGNVLNPQWMCHVEVVDGQAQFP